MTYPPSPRTDAGDTTALAHPYFAGLPSPDSADFESLCRFCEDHRITVLASLPWVAAEVAALGGFAAMLRLVRRHGGRRLYLPRGRTACSVRLGVALDAPTHRRLLDRASAAGTIEIPSAWGVFVGLRRVAIRAAVRAGRSQREVAQSFGVTERHLRREADSIQLADRPAADPDDATCGPKN
ncbi:hypothetical protein IEQ11_00220 [Lysobacter capsici]|uniref:Mor transcription activator domain-containing protein n=1 Tax=Lysobacter capsici AZ78 TaxID=1444315 RepID=A0A108UA79_9GAMM|nr:hypothetical protein [Lysobacter capsici]KWS05401.1 hypothetical protein AZ78_2953 [Lysobacter capsici AZ78]UOF15129.1 hypothetical protein IEQ11_00220 [Lysobacter capsici]